MNNIVRWEQFYKKNTGKQILHFQKWWPQFRRSQTKNPLGYNGARKQRLTAQTRCVSPVQWRASVAPEQQLGINVARGQRFHHPFRHTSGQARPSFLHQILIVSNCQLRYPKNAKPKSAIIVPSNNDAKNTKPIFM